MYTARRAQNGKCRDFFCIAWEKELLYLQREEHCRTFQRRSKELIAIAINNGSGRVIHLLILFPLFYYFPSRPLCARTLRTVVCHLRTITQKCWNMTWHTQWRTAGHQIYTKSRKHDIYKKKPKNCTRMNSYINGSGIKKWSRHIIISKFSLVIPFILKLYLCEKVWVLMV
jgi:hypothetical protein